MENGVYTSALRKLACLNISCLLSIRIVFRSGPWAQYTHTLICRESPPPLEINVCNKSGNPCLFWSCWPTFFCTAQAAIFACHIMWTTLFAKGVWREGESKKNVEKVHWRGQKNVQTNWSKKSPVAFSVKDAILERRKTFVKFVSGAQKERVLTQANRKKKTKWERGKKLFFRFFFGRKTWGEEKISLGRRRKIRLLLSYIYPFLLLLFSLFFLPGACARSGGYKRALNFCSGLLYSLWFI